MSKTRAKTRTIRMRTLYHPCAYAPMHPRTHPPTHSLTTCLHPLSHSPPPTLSPPPVLSCSGRTFPVERLFLEDVYESTGYMLDPASR